VTLFRLTDSNSRNQKFNGRALLLVASVLACLTLSQTAEGALAATDTAYGARASDSNRYDRSFEQWKRLPRANSFVSATVGSIAGTVWKPLGPSPIVENGCCVSPTVTFAANGRVNSIAVDPTNSDVLYLGSAGGGVWKSIDRGVHWQPMTDQEISLGIGSSHAIAVDPNHANTIYAGTSDFAQLDQSLPRPRDLAQSRGILKSTDGGASWIRLGSGIPTGNSGKAASLFKGVNINTIIVDPANSNVLYLAAGRGNDPNYGGVFCSVDGGLNWTKGKGTENMWVESLVLDTSSSPGSRVLFAGAWNQGVLKSTNGGQNFTPVLTASTPVVAAAAPAGFLKTMVALAPPANPPLQSGPVIYASLWIIAPSGSPALALLFSNANGGDSGSWVQRNAQVILTAFKNPDGTPQPLIGSPFSDMVVDPSSPGDGVGDRIYWGAGTQFLSTDSGDTFNEIGQINGIHGDHQTWLVVPHTGTNTVYVGDDGGIWRSEDQGQSWTGTSLTSLASTINGGGLQIATLYQLTIQQDATAAVTVGGAQDSGILRLPPSPVLPPFPIGGQPWSGTSNDGVDVVFEKVASNDAYSIQNACDGDRLFKSTDSATSWGDTTACPCPPPPPTTCLIPVSERGTFQNRLAVDPSHAGYLYVGGSAGSVYQTTDGGSSFPKIGSPAPGNYITSLDVAPGDSNRLVVASQNQVFVTTNALAATVKPPSAVVFQDITGDLPARFVTRVAFDPNDADTVYATLAGFGDGHVFRKSITTTNWTDISPPVDIPVNAIALDGSSNPAILYIGTDLGVLRRSIADGSPWEVVDDLHLPNAAVSDLEINTTAGVLRAATWGRGVFELAAPTGPAILVGETVLDFGEACAETGADRLIHVSNAGSQNLVVSSVQRLAGSSSFTVLGTPSTPLSIAPGDAATFTAHYTPTVPGTAESAIIRISSNDSAVPFVDLVATGTLETSPPNISSVSATPNVLTPPNHKMVPVALTVAVSDNCDAAVGQSCHVVSVTSNEPISGNGEGDTAPDWEITGNLTLNLRAERSGGGTGRIYTISVQCTDNAGNSASRSTTVTVPHL